MNSLANAIIQQDIPSVVAWLNRGVDPNAIDEYGFTPLIEAAIADNVEIAKRLLFYAVDVNQQDATGNTALHWAVENNNLELVQLLLQRGANPNAVSLAGQPVMVMSILRRQSEMKKLLYKAGASEVFAQDFINIKLLGHMYELVGTATIVDPKKNFVEVSFEGFFLEITLGLICDALAQFQNNYGARRLKKYLGLSQVIVDVMNRAAQLVKYRQYRVDVSRYEKNIRALLQEPLILPIGYEGHAITFIKYGNIMAKCDRRDNREYNEIICYRVTRPEQYTPELVMHLLYDKQNSHFINDQLPGILGLEPLTVLKVESQISGNCSWANVEACIPTLFFLILSSLPGGEDNLPQYKSLALNFFHRWRDWNKERLLHFCIQNFKDANPVRRACKAEILAAILFQRCDSVQYSDKIRVDTILNLLAGSPYEYILHNYLQAYYYRSPTEEGARFSKLMKEYGVLKS